MEPTASLLERFAELHDPRSRRGRRYSLESLLSLAAVAMMSGMTSLEAIAHFGRLRGPRLTHLLGFRDGDTPSKATYSRLFAALDAAEVEAVFADWVRDRCPPETWRHLTLDGEALRGSRDGEAPGVHLLTAYAPEVAAVVGQLRVDGKTNEHKAALELLGVLPLAGKVVTADAMFTHRDVCTAIRDGGGDYLLPVKDNQPRLRADIEAAFAPPAGLSPPQARRRREALRVATASGKGHGRRERRTLMATDGLNDYLDWPGVGQVFLLWRERTIGGVTTVEEVFGITSLRPEQASAADLLELVRRHWSIENQLFGVRDGTLREDACRVRSGGAPQVLASLRNALLHLLADAGFPGTAAAIRHFMVHPLEAVERLRQSTRE